MVHTQHSAVSTESAEYDRNTATRWVGWVLFAAVLMLVDGFFNIIQGFVALVRDDFYAVGKNGLVVSVDYTAWGWTLLLLGVLLVATGYGVMIGQTWARVTGVILVILNAIVNMLFMPAYPIWSIMAITIDVFLIYALIVHGREAKRINP